MMVNEKKKKLKVSTNLVSDPDDVCDSNEFQCNSNKRCISEHLVCDRFEDCADASDECLLSTPAIIGIAVGGVTAFLLIVGIFICVCCYRSRRVRTGSTKPLSQHDTSVSVFYGKLQTVIINSIVNFKLNLKINALIISVHLDSFNINVIRIHSA